MPSAIQGMCVCVSPHASNSIHCISSALEELDATYDSDNEADYTKMDMVCTYVCTCVVA